MNAPQEVGISLKRIPSPPLNWNNIQKTKADAKREQQKQHWKNESLARELDEREAQNRCIRFKQFLKNSDLSDSLPLEAIKTSLHKGGIQDKMRKAKKDLLDKVRKTIAIQLQNEAENEYAIDREHLSDDDNFIPGDEDEIDIDADETTFENGFDNNAEIGEEESVDENAFEIDNEVIRATEKNNDFFEDDENSDFSDNDDEISNSSCSDTNNDNNSVSSKEQKRQKIMKSNFVKNALPSKTTSYVPATNMSPKLSKKIKSKTSRIEINALREKYFGSKGLYNGTSSQDDDTNLTLLVRALDNTKTKKLRLPPQLKNRLALTRHPSQ